MYKNTEDAAMLIGLLDDEDFKALSVTEKQFNIFDALGVRRQEIRHSDFLSYLLDPNLPHGLGDGFLRDFLLEATEEAEMSLPDVFNGVSLRLDALTDVQVTRERHNIDILLEMDGQWLVAIENKIGSKEHSNQLERYEARLKSLFPSLPTIFIYLTPFGDLSSKLNWIPLSYNKVHKLASKWAESSNTSSKVRIALLDYIEFLEGHVLEDSKTAELCRKIYKRHKQAIELLVEHVPTTKDFYFDIAQRAIQILADEGKVILDDKYRKVSRFYDSRLEACLPELPEGSWTGSNKGILFEWEIDAEFLRVDLVIGPLDDELRKSIIDQLEAAKYKSTLRGVSNLKIVTRISKLYTHYTKTPIVAFEKIDEDIERDHIDDLVTEFKCKVEEIINIHFEVLRNILAIDR